MSSRIRALEKRSSALLLDLILGNIYGKKGCVSAAILLCPPSRERCDNRWVRIAFARIFFFTHAGVFIRVEISQKPRKINEAAKVDENRRGLLSCIRVIRVSFRNRAIP